MSDHEPELLALIHREIARSGPLTFARFMDLALYAPGLGYYMRDAGRIGAQGDYYTSGNLHPLFGETVARQLDEMAALAGPGFTVIEQGAGRGALAYDVLRATSSEGSDGPWPYLIVERSPAMVERQRQVLAPWAASGRVSWIEAFPNQPVNGCIVSNELVDAFPVHRVVQRDGALQEVYVAAAEAGVAEILGPPSTSELAAYLDRLGVTLAEGQYAEINLAAIEWMRAVGRAIDRGFAITIDYGHPAEELYGPHRPRGTLFA
ncbi:MAG: SAM-dependent methyltransferase, partial [Nitrospiria bacterium]